MSEDSERSKKASQTSHAEVPSEKSPSRRDILLTSTALVAATALGAALGSRIAEAEDKPRRRLASSRIFSSSGATISDKAISAPSPRA